MKTLNLIKNNWLIFLTWFVSIVTFIFIIVKVNVVIDYILFTRLKLIKTENSALIAYIAIIVIVYAVFYAACKRFYNWLLSKLEH